MKFGQMKLIVCMTITPDEGGNNASLCFIHSKLVLFVNWSSRLVLFVIIGHLSNTWNKVWHVGKPIYWIV